MQPHVCAAAFGNDDSPPRSRASLPPVTVPVATVQYRGLVGGTASVIPALGNNDSSKSLYRDMCFQDLIDALHDAPDPPTIDHLLLNHATRSHALFSRACWPNAVCATSGTLSMICFLSQSHGALLQGSLLLTNSNDILSLSTNYFNIISL